MAIDPVLPHDLDDVYGPGAEDALSGFDPRERNELLIQELMELLGVADCEELPDKVRRLIHDAELRLRADGEGGATGLPPQCPECHQRHTWKHMKQETPHPPLPGDGAGDGAMSDMEYRFRFASRLIERGFTLTEACASAEAAEIDHDDMAPEDHANDEASYD